jgi:WD40 repeat protein
MLPLPHLELASHCIAATFVADIPFFALADGTIHRWDDGDCTTVAHSGLLAAVPTRDRAALLTGGEDGRVCRIGHSGNMVELARMPRKWMTAVASGPDGVFAFVSGRTVWLHDSAGSARELQHSSGVEDIAFAPDGSRIAVARYDCVSIHSVTAGSDPVELRSKGMHAGLIFSPDGLFLLMTMKENTLQGWRLRDAQHFRMTGYSARVEDWSWSADGNWLATSGAPTAILWPFAELDGPIGKIPIELGTPGDSFVTSVACHPTKELVAVGHADGAILAVRIDAEDEAPLRRSGRGKVTSLAWDPAGNRLAFGSEHGECGVIDVPA